MDLGVCAMPYMLAKLLHSHMLKGVPKIALDKFCVSLGLQSSIDEV